MATKIKTPSSMRQGAPARPAPENPRQSAGPSRQQLQAENRPEYESQVPGLIDRAGAERAAGRIAVPELLKKKKKIQKKYK